ncbi:MAG: MBL fold metallo-hydrolase [Pyrinomonadaceae bacterium]
MPITHIAVINNISFRKKAKRLSRIRLGDEAVIETSKYGEAQYIDGVKISFHPAGHVLGSAQLRVEYKGEIWVVSGDYKLTPDATCAPFEPMQCHNFITEATFGLPIYRWTPTEIIFEEINQWWRRNQERGKVSVIFAYSLGKAQRVMNGIDRRIGQIFTHGAVERLTQAYRESGVDLPETKYVGAVANKKDFAGSLIVAPPSAAGSTWLKRFGVHSTGFRFRLDGRARRTAEKSGRPRICSYLTMPIGKNCKRQSAQQMPKRFLSRTVLFPNSFAG